MTEQDRQHALEVIEWFSNEAYKKYARGVVEHGGYLPCKGGLLAEAEAECLDLPIYVRTLRVQLTRVLHAIEDGRAQDAANALRDILHGTPDDRLPV